MLQEQDVGKLLSMQLKKVQTFDDFMDDAEEQDKKNRSEIAKCDEDEAARQTELDQARNMHSRLTEEFDSFPEWPEGYDKQAEPQLKVRATAATKATDAAVV